MTVPVAPARHDFLRRHNFGVVLQAIAANGTLSRAQVAAETGLTKATVSQLAERLVSCGLVTELEPVRGSVGRPGSPLRVNRDDGRVGLGLEIAADYIAVCAVDLAGEMVRHMIEGRENRGVPASVVVDRAATLVHTLREGLETDGRALLGIGIALPGLVEGGQVVRLAPNLPGWNDLPISAHMSVALATLLPIEAENEANLAAMAEFWYGGAQGRTFVHVSGEIGVGGGVVVDGELFRGVRGFAGELGHVTVNPEGPACGCGSRGCLEQYAGQEALLQGAGVTAMSGTRDGDPGGAVHELVSRAEAGHGPTLDVLASAGTALGVALGALVNVLDVPTVVLGGIYAPLARWLVEPVSLELRRRALADRWDPVKVIVSTLGTQAAVRGAAGVSVDRVIRDPVAYFPSLQLG
ncbi:MAG: transcriptional regulator [Frankiales bacterium]|nr:transcriptional regulator [Frankiales bacterium]